MIYTHVLQSTNDKEFRHESDSLKCQHERIIKDHTVGILNCVSLEGRVLSTACSPKE